MAVFPISIMSPSLHMDLPSTVKWAAEHGVQGLQLSIRDNMSPERLTRDRIAEARRLMADNGLNISAVCGDLGQGFTHEEKNAVLVDMSKRILELSQELGTFFVTTHIGCVPEDFNTKRYEVLWKACREMGEYAESLGMRFAVETGPEPAERLKRFLDTLPTKGIGVNLDPANLAMVCEDDPVQAVYTLKDYIVHTHAKDGKNLVHCNPEVIYGEFDEENLENIQYFIETPLGQGAVPFDAYLKALDDIGYRGYLAIEREVGATPQDDIAMAIGFLKSKF